VREEEGGGQGRPVARGGGGGRLREDVLVDCVSSPPKAPLYIGVGGAPYPLPKAALGRRPREEEGGGQGWWGPVSPPKTLTLAGLGQGSRAPLFFFLPHGLLSENWPIR
jgi:hypothetical protein